MNWNHSLETSNLYNFIRKNGKYIRFALITNSADHLFDNSSVSTNGCWVVVKDKSKGSWSSVKDKSKGCWSSCKDKSKGCWSSVKDKSKGCWTSVKGKSGTCWKVVKEKSALCWRKVVDWSKKSYDYCRKQCEKCRPKPH